MGLTLPTLQVNISVAIMPMATDYGWSSSVSGLIQSAFFYGAQSRRASRC